ncbi:MAG: NAD(P)H-dependent oxidoreductase [Propionibacteriaceae bacterium]|nr:NAD(P)H-dependent oxidoreductase [Propionibacteriaceae bacterium]
MRVHIVFAHPSAASFTRSVLNSFTLGLAAAGHTFTVSDLYAMGFSPVLTQAEYQRESTHEVASPVPADVAAEQAKLNAADAWVFIYPVWWTDCPAILKGWFDRVWTVGYAHHSSAMPQAEHALVLCTAGHAAEYLRGMGFWPAMETVMLGDRIANRAKTRQFVVFDGSEAVDAETWKTRKAEHLAMAMQLGLDLGLSRPTISRPW